jgi:hypothetical protein
MNIDAVHIRALPGARTPDAAAHQPRLIATAMSAC